MFAVLLSIWIGFAACVGVKADEKTQMTRIPVRDGQPREYQDALWSGYTYGEGNGVAIDLWNLTTQVTCTLCEFRHLTHSGAGGRAGIIHCEEGRLIINECLFWYCTCNSGGILHLGVGPSDVELTNCTLYDCKTWRPGAMIYFPMENEENTLAVTGCNMSLCKVCQWNGNTHSAPVDSYDPLIMVRALRTFVFTDNTFLWKPQDVQTNWRSSCLLDLSFTQLTDVVLERCYIENTTFSWGLVLLQKAQSITYRDMQFVEVSVGKDVAVGFLPVLPDNEGDSVTKITLERCSWTIDDIVARLHGCNTSSYFIGTGAESSFHALKTLEILDCTFSKCWCNASAFLLLDSCENVVFRECSFNNIWFQEPFKSNALLLSVVDCGAGHFSDTSFNLRNMGISDAILGVSFLTGDYWFSRCAFLADGEAENSPLQLMAAKSEFNGCEFNLVNVNASIAIENPLLSYKGIGKDASLLFYNCCFTHDIAEGQDSTGALYLQLSGNGNVTFGQGVCFDVSDKATAYSADRNINVDGYDERLFGDCQCNVVLPEPTYETVITDAPYVPPSGDDGAKTANVGLITGVFFGLLILIILLALIILFLLWRRRRKEGSTEPPPQEEQPEETITTISGIDGDDFDGNTNDNPLFATELSTNDVFSNGFEEKGSFFMNGA